MLWKYALCFWENNLMMSLGLLYLWAWRLNIILKTLDFERHISVYIFIVTQNTLTYANLRYENDPVS